ncbi:MAG: acyl carrier protein [Burkholderiales bacterium]|nr:acyl carrier protein [Burkholderiales bacterium]MDR4517415.1 acyl carrier protein [Nitrosomonas sp.]
MTYQSILQWISIRLAELVKINVDQIDPQLPFDRYGLDSLSAVTLIGELGDWLQLELDPSIVYDYPTIEQLSKYVSEQINGGDA